MPGGVSGGRCEGEGCYRAIWQRGKRLLLVHFHFRSLPDLPSGPVIFLVWQSTKGTTAEASRIPESHCLRKQAEEVPDMIMRWEYSMLPLYKCFASMSGR